jgi:hypothetical protein
MSAELRAELPDPPCPHLDHGIWRHQRIPVAQFFRCLTEQQRDDIRQLARDHGQNPNECYDIQYAVIDAPLLTIWIYDRNDQGHRYLSQREPWPDGVVIAHHTVDVLLRAPLPNWWQP